MNHPHLNPQENPSAALYRLLNLLPDTRPFITTPETAQITQAICYHARRTSQAVTSAIAALRPLVAPSPAAPPHAVLQPVFAQLVQEANNTHAIAEVYQTLLDRFYQRHPHLRQAANDTSTAIEPNSLMAEYNKHYYFPLGKLLQLLPGDITNQPHLSQEQGKMCLAVSEFADRAHATLCHGLTALAQLMNSAPPEPLPALNLLVDFLQAQADFMQECSADYRDAATCIVQKG